MIIEAAFMTHLVLYGNLQSGMRSRDGNSTLKVDIFPEILLLIQKYFSQHRTSIPFFLFLFFFKLSADFYTSVNSRFILSKMDVYYICAISS